MVPGNLVQRFQSQNLLRDSNHSHSDSELIQVVLAHLHSIPLYWEYWSVPFFRRGCNTPVFLSYTSQEGSETREQNGAKQEVVNPPHYCMTQILFPHTSWLRFCISSCYSFTFNPLIPLRSTSHETGTGTSNARPTTTIQTAVEVSGSVLSGPMRGLVSVGPRDQAALFKAWFNISVCLFDF